MEIPEDIIGQLRLFLVIWMVKNLKEGWFYWVSLLFNLFGDLSFLLDDFLNFLDFLNNLILFQITYFAHNLLHDIFLNLLNFLLDFIVDNFLNKHEELGILSYFSFVVTYIANLEWSAIEALIDSGTNFAK